MVEAGLITMLMSLYISSWLLLNSAVTLHTPEHTYTVRNWGDVQPLFCAEKSVYNLRLCCNSFQQ